MKSSVDEEPAPVMMTFKKFLATQDDSITDEEAIAKYSEYKLEFKRQELHKFFLAHKDEEWWVMAAMLHASSFFFSFSFLFPNQVIQLINVSVICSVPNEGKLMYHCSFSQIFLLLFDYH